MKSAQATSTVGLAAMAGLLNGGTLQFFTNPVPASPEGAVGTATLLGTATFAALAYGSPAVGAGFVSVQGAFASTTVNPVAGGTCTWARAFRSGGATPVDDFTAGTAGTDIILSNATFAIGNPLVISSMQLTLPCD